MSWQHTSLLCGCAVHGGEGNFSTVLLFAIAIVAIAKVEDQDI
jgi:hypothetical protein